MDTCQSYEGCSAPICPLDSSFNYAIWYPDELICVKRELSPEIRKIVRTQKKISRRAKNSDLYYTLDALKSIKRVSTHIRGRNSDNTYKPSVLNGLILQTGVSANG